MSIISKAFFDHFMNRYQAKLDTAIKEYVGDKADPANEMFFESGTVIPENADLNNYMNLGKFYSPNRVRTLTLSNTPSNLGGFTLFVVRHTENTILQIVQMNNSVKVTYYTRYISTSSPTTYGNWVHLSEKEIPQSGTQNIDGLFYGYITTGAKEIAFYIPMAKDWDGYTVTATASQLVMRGVNGYIQDSNTAPFDIASGTVNVEVFKTGIKVRCEISTEFTNATNNTPVDFSGRVTFTLTKVTE